MDARDGSHMSRETSTSRERSIVFTESADRLAKESSNNSGMLDPREERGKEGRVPGKRGKVRTL